MRARRAERPTSSSRTALLLLLAGVVVILLLLVARGPLVELLTGGPPEAAVLEESDVEPPGFWNRSPVATAPGASAEERARLISLPYLGGRAPAPDGAQQGVVRLDRDAVHPGVNLYVSGHGPEAVLIDLEGRPLHRWRLPFRKAFPGARPTADTGFFRRARLLEDGVLLALYQTGGLVFLDRRSGLLGRCEGNFYNDFWTGEDGRIWTIAKEVADGGGGGERLDDFLVELRHAGHGEGCREVRRISITRAFLGSPFAHLLDARAPAGDVLHTNTVTELAEVPGSSPLAPGDLLISLREVDVVATVDPAAETVTWARSGPWEGQHEPLLLDSGEILLFDNRGLDGSSRLLQLDPATGEVTWSWSAEPPEAFSSPEGGSCARLPNGNTLVTESVPGRAFELDPEGRVVWELLSPHRAGPEGSLVAMLFEVVRLPAEPWMEPDE